MNDPEATARSEAARLMGRSRSPKKIAAIRQNALLGAEARRAARRPLSEYECTCGAGDALEGHARKCPRYMAIYNRKRKGLPLE